MLYLGRELITFYWPKLFCKNYHIQNFYKVRENLNSEIPFRTLPSKDFSITVIKLALNDLRFIKTLDKLCIFLGHYDLNEYILNSKQLTISDDDSEQIEPYRKIIETFCQNEFKAIQKLLKLI